MNISPRWLGKIPGARRLFFNRGQLSPGLRSTAFLLCFLGSLLLMGCSGGEQRADIVIINGGEPESLDPAIGTGIEDSRITSALFEGLTRSDPKTGLPIPGLAERWEISADGKTYTFHLRNNLFWGKNDPITAEDVAYSWRRLLDPRTGAMYAGQLFYLKNGEEFNRGEVTDPAQLGLRVLDLRTIQAELKAPTPFFLDLCACQTLAVVPRRLVETHGDRWIMSEHPLPASGPYQFEKWRLNDKIRIRKNPFYWDAANTRSETIDFLPIGAPSTVLNLYDSGQADIIWDKETVPAELIDVLKQRPDFHSYDYLGTYFLRFNTTRPPFNDVRARKALNLAIDRKRIIEKILRCTERVATRLVPEGAAHCSPIRGLACDPAMARRLLAEAGYPGGANFPTVNYLLDSTGGGGKVQLKIAVEIQQMWEKELGVHVELRQMEKKVYLAAQSHLDYDVSRSSWIGDYNDPTTFLDLFLSNSANNRCGWTNAAYDQLMHQAGLQTDLTERAATLARAERILIEEDAPIAPIYHYAGFNFFNPERIQGIDQNFPDIHPLNYIGRKPLKTAESANRNR